MLGRECTSAGAIREPPGEGPGVGCGRREPLARLAPSRAGRLPELPFREDDDLVLGGGRLRAVDALLGEVERRVDVGRLRSALPPPRLALVERRENRLVAAAAVEQLGAWGAMEPKVR